MSIRIVLKLLGLLAMGLGLTLLVPLAWSLYFADGAALSFVVSIAISGVVGAGLFFLNRKAKSRDIFRREGLAFVGLGWVLCSVLGALPFMLSGTLPSFVDAVFESMSGLTTTGASVFGAEHFVTTPKSVMFWRSLTHWLGGMGIVVLFVAFLPLLGVGGKQLLKFEVPGPKPEGLRPRITQTASLLWKIYLGISVLETVLLMVEGMSLYEALCHTFGTMATGGFSTEASSIAAYDSTAIDVTIIFFMVLAGTNFSLYYRLLKGERLALFKDIEWRAYIGILVGATAILTVLLWSNEVYKDWVDSLRYSAFQVVSLTTTTGFATADFNTWPPAARVISVLLMFVGGSAGSTGGGMKVIRWVIWAKLAVAGVKRVFHPHAVTRVKIGTSVVDDDTQRELLGFFMTWIGLFGLFTLIVSFFVPQTAGSDDITTAATAVAATLNNIGPGLASVGAVENFSHFAPVAKVALTICMALGRLELFAVLSLVVPSFWRTK